MKTQWMQSKHPKEPMLPSKGGPCGTEPQRTGARGQVVEQQECHWTPDPGRWLK